MRTKAERDAEKLTHCQHFNGVQNKTCDAGVAYQDVSVGDGEWRVSTVPCWSLCAEAKCDKRELWTPEALAEQDRQFAEAFQRTMIARGAIVEHTGGKRGIGGEIDCPICKTGKLRFSVAGVNGHIHAGCTTEDCVCWME